MPSHFSFHDLIVAKARGKSGPMFDFSAREDVRLVGDVRTESDAVHPGRSACARGTSATSTWPASRWEDHEPGVDHGERATRVKCASMSCHLASNAHPQLDQGPARQPQWLTNCSSNVCT